MEKLRVLDLFSGIGGFSLGLERTGGYENIAFCEIDPFCRRVLAKHWPNVRQFEDVTKLRGEDVGPVDVICGGFPCQDVSVAGSRSGISGQRSGLWSHFFRLIAECEPSVVIIENVPGLLNGGDWIELPSDQCVCGWIVGRRRLHQHRREGARVLREGGRGNGAEGYAGASEDEGRIRRKHQSSSASLREVGGSARLEGVRKGLGGLSDGGIPSFGAEAPSGRTGVGASPTSRRAAEADERLRVVDGRGHQARKDNPCGGHGSQSPWPSIGGSVPRLDCPSCGRDMGDAAGRSHYASWFGRVQRDLASIGFHAEWSCVPASYVGARQLRDRVWVVAHSQRHRIQGGAPVWSAWEGQSREEQLAGLVQPCAWPTVSGARDRGTGHGVPDGTHRNKALGNAVVPQIPELIGRAILETRSAA